MKKADIVNVTIRLNRNTKRHKMAWDILENVEKGIFKSKIGFIVEALIYYDEYLKSEIKANEELERQEKFLKEIEWQVKNTIQSECGKCHQEHQVKYTKQELEQKEHEKVQEVKEKEDILGIDETVASFLNNL